MSLLEIESKWELSPLAFERFLRSFRPSICKRQLNIYYDAGWLLADMAATLRIRFAHFSYPMMTLKLPVRQHGAKRVMREIEIELSEQWRTKIRSSHPSYIEVQSDLPAEVGGRLGFLGIRRLERVGWVRNTRFLITVGGEGEIELDRLELPDGTVFHEAEIETSSDRAHSRLSSLIAGFAPDAKPSLVSKFQRFRNAVETPSRIVDQRTHCCDSPRGAAP